MCARQLKYLAYVEEEHVAVYLLAQEDRFIPACIKTPMLLCGDWRILLDTR